MIRTSLVFLSYFSILLIKGITGQGLVSPCPELFAYLPNEATTTRWSGEINLKTDVELTGVYIRVMFDRPPTEVTGNFGDVVQREALEYLIRKPGYKVSPGSSEKIKITVDYVDVSPKLIGFRLNAKVVCPPENIPARKAPVGSLVSPCPYVFQYDPTGAAPNEWDGTLTLTSTSELTGIYSRIIFDKPPVEVTADFGDVVQREATQYLIRQPSHILPVGTALRIKINVRYNVGEVPPKITGVQLNANAVCPGESSKLESTTTIAKGLVSPCSDIFSYQRWDRERGKWHGLILLNTRIALKDVTITIVLDRPSLQLGGWHGELRTQDNVEYHLTKPGLVVYPGGYSFEFFIKYKTNRPIPKLSEIFLNRQSVCPDDESLLLTRGPGISTITTASRQPSVSESAGDQIECGTLALSATPFITEGLATLPGQHPWHAGLYHNKNVGLTYICGGNLISKNFLLTAAHCSTRQATGEALTASLLVAVLGKYYLDITNSTGTQEKNVRRVIVHPNYDKMLFKNDIALLQLDSPIQITDTVRPICLWTEPANLQSVIGQEGTVVGWGWTEQGRLSPELMKTNMPIVDRLKCILSYPEFFAKFTNDNNYCAGFKNGSSACNGDSGGGMALPKMVNGKTIWYLRGLVSVGVALQNLNTCDASHFVVFTDVPQFINWIKQNMRI